MTKKQLGILRLASRKCGLSYRAACNRDINAALALKKEGYLKLTDNGKELGRFVFWATDKGREFLS